MNALKSIYALAAFIMLFITGTALFNYSVDPLCFFRCDVVNVSRKNVNFFYQIAQRVLAYPEAEQVIIGSSRGESIPLQSLQQKTGLKTLNLSIGGAEMLSKLAFLKLSEQNLKLKRVLWVADYFEVLTDLADPRVIYSNALNSYVPASLQIPSAKRILGRFSRLFDRQTIEASFHALSLRNSIELDQGANNRTYEECEKAEAQRGMTPETLAKEIDLIYNNFSGQVFKSKENPNAWIEFEKAILETSKKGIEVVILIPPFHPTFINKLENQHPDLYKNHMEWLKKVHLLAGNKINVIDYFTGIPNGDSSIRFWVDGVHFTCRGIQNMLSEPLGL